MKRLFILIGLLLCAIPACATTYFIAPSGGGGSDSNNGTASGTPWLTPNHALNCGDVVSAAAGTYAEANFRTGEWGVVTCAAGNNVAWLKCATFDTCKISITGANDGMAPTQSYWGIQGWEITATSGSGSQCFNAYVPNSTTSVHHIVFANNIANGCSNGGFTVGAFSSTVGVDYVAELGNISYNAAQNNANCYSGIDMVYPVNTDTLPGTHIYIAGNFAWGNVDPNPCGGGLPTDGHGLSLDSLSASTYTGQVVLANNISVFNGAAGFQNFSSTTAPVYVFQNTFYGNQTGTTNANPCAELNINTASLTQSFGNLVMATTNTCSGSVAEYALGSSTDAASDIFYSNFIYSAAGHNTNFSSGVGVNNTSGTNPSFSSPTEPSAPSCGSFASVPACMATVVANFTPATAAAKPYGYQIPSTTSVYDPYYPQWLCGVTNLPTGLVTPGCATGLAASGGVSLNGGAVDGYVALPIAFVTSATAASANAIVVATTAADFSGCTPSCTLVMIGSYLSGASITPSDSSLNSWTDDQDNSYQSVWHKTNATVTASQTFTLTCSGSCYPSVVVLAFKNASSGLDSATPTISNTGGATTLQPGSFTPSKPGAVVISALNFAQAGAITISSPFSSPVQSNFGGGTNYGDAGSYLIQTTAAAENPTWSATGPPLYAIQLAYDP